jgi:hypothetical protein
MRRGVNGQTRPAALPSRGEVDMNAPAELNKPSLLDRSREMMEEFGLIFVGVVMSLFVIEMTVLVTMISMGVDLGPFATWVQSTFGWDISGVLEAAGTIGVAYAITRILKPFQLGLAFVLTPIVGRIWHGTHDA